MREGVLKGFQRIIEQNFFSGTYRQGLKEEKTVLFRWW